MEAKHRAFCINLSSGSQVQDPILNLLCAALIPILRTNIAAGSACYVHLTLIRIPALRTHPNQLSIRILPDFNFAVKAANLTIVALGIQLGVHDVIINKLHDLQNRVDIVLHIRHFHIADGTAGAELLKFRLKCQLGKRVNLLANMDMIRIGDIILIRDPRNHPKALLQATGKLIGGGLQRCAVEGVIDILRLFHSRHLSFMRCMTDSAKGFACASV